MNACVINKFTFQCEGRIKKLHDEDTRMLKILSKQCAQRNWNKVKHILIQRRVPYSSICLLDQ
jgi:hypothetical protein